MKIILYALLLLCTAPSLAAGNIEDAPDQTTSHTGVGATEQEACTRARSLASEDSREPGPCVCEMHGNTNICHAESTRPGSRSATMIPPKVQARPAEAPARLTTSTASAPTQEEACKKAQAMAGKDSDAGECACQARGNGVTCKVQSVDVAPTSSVIDTIKKPLRELAKCNPADTDCKQPSRSFGSRS